VDSADSDGFEARTHSMLGNQIYQDELELDGDIDSKDGANGIKLMLHSAGIPILSDDRTTYLIVRKQFSKVRRNSI
jgi:hypothetical protein